MTDQARGAVMVLTSIIKSIRVLEHSAFGTVRSPIRSGRLLELKAPAIGDVRDELLEMHQSATVNGELGRMNAAEKPGRKLATSNPG